jgi:beta-ring hydroxylase
VGVQVDTVIGDGIPSMEQVRALPYTTRVISEAMRLYPQPPVLIRRAVEEDTLAGYTVAPGSDLFISVWNLHRCLQHILFIAPLAM